MSIGSAIGSPIGRAIGSALAGGGSAPAFDPATLFTGGKKGVWIKPRDWTTLRQNYGGTGSVTVATDPVGYATDLSGNGEHFTQATGTARPLAITVGGRNAIDFDGTDDKLVSGSVTAGDWTTMDFFIVVYLDAFSASGWLVADDAVSRFFGVATHGIGSSATNGSGSPTYAVNGTDVPGGTSVTRQQLYDALTTGGWLVVEANGLDLSAWTLLLFGGYVNFQLNGKCAELILCEAVDDATRARVRTYLGSAVGLTI